jgi:hypothetical protein
MGIRRSLLVMDEKESRLENNWVMIQQILRMERSLSEAEWIWQATGFLVHEHSH